MSSAMKPLDASLDASFDTRLGVPLRALGEQPYLLAAFLILINALFAPYVGIVHDSQLYAGLVLNRINPEFLGSDLFFQYGSQDKYSAFSTLMAPFVALMGPKLPFFVGYLLSISLFLTALTRLVTKLWPGSPAAVVGLIFLAIVPVAYGGHVPLHVIEPFLSARVPACALTVWAMVEFFERRYLRCILAMGFAFALHILMTLPGAMVLVIVMLARRWGFWGVAVPTLVSSTAFGILLATPSVALRVFGEYDAEWLELTQTTNCYMFLQEWLPVQWFWNLFTLAALAVGAWASRGSDADRGRLLAGIVMIGVAGFFGTLLFSVLPYALLIKGQAYRWLWLPMAIAPPAILHMAHQAWRRETMASRLAAVGLVAFLGMTTYAPIEFLCLGCFLPVTYYAAITFGRKASPADRVGYALAASVALGIVLWGGFRLWNFRVNCQAIQGELNPVNWFDITLATLGGGILVMTVLVVLAIGGGRLARVRHAWSLIVAALIVQSSLFTWMLTDHFRSYDPHADELRFVDNFLKERKREEGRDIAIYSNFGRLYQYWIEWGTRSYYDCFQLAGFCFNRDTAVEGYRRAKIVGPFEAAALAKGRSEVIPYAVKERISAWLGSDIDDPPPPTEDDLLRLAREESIDYIVLFTSHFDHLAVVRHGKVSIYDCRALRASLCEINPSGRFDGRISQAD